ncbi:hypothetical protein BB558_005259 [Smittium angustum]|uniref:Sodium/calcium exchanger membrane region domain-containing protein n=1 Tax=Smittium angustum TaxID=133377 RepID=A0A2U1J0Z3_SMIAN|nr:hypothetical protein BB558_005259 [Smittium angustum]
MSDSVAGVTLLALGNGASDLFTTFAAFKADVVPLAFGDLIGGAMFIVCIVGGLMMIVSKGFEIPKIMVIREMSALAVAIAIVMLMILRNRIVITTATIMIVFYLLYVTYVVLYSYMISRRSKIEQAILESNPMQNDEINTNTIAPENLSQLKSNDLSIAEKGEYQENRATHKKIDLPNNEDSKPQLVKNHLKYYPRSLIGAAEFKNFFDRVSSNPVRNFSKSDPGLMEGLNNTENTFELSLKSSVEIDVLPVRSQIAHGNSNQFLSPMEANPNLNNYGAPDYEYCKKLSFISSNSGDISNRFENELPEIVVSPPSIINFEMESYSESSDITSSIIIPNITPETTSVPDPSSHLVSNKCWYYFIAFVPTFKRWKHKTAWYMKLLLLYSAIPVILVTITVPVLLDLPKHDSNRPRLGLDAVMDVLSAVSSPMIGGVFGLKNTSKTSENHANNNAPLDTIPRDSGLCLDEKLNSTPTRASELDAYASSVPIIKIDNCSNSSRAVSNRYSQDLGSYSFPRKQEKSSNQDCIEKTNSATHNSNMTISISFEANNLGADIHNVHGSNTNSFRQKSADISEPYHKIKSLKVLKLVQCVASPMFISCSLIPIADLNHSILFYGIAISIISVSMFILGEFLNMDDRIDNISTNDDGKLIGALKKVYRILRYLPMFVGFASGIFWIYLISNEIVGTLQILRVILGISRGLLGLTVLAIGNSIGDLAANLTVSRLGYPIMAISACFGGPLLNILIDNYKLPETMCAIFYSHDAYSISCANHHNCASEISSHQKNWYFFDNVLFCHA